VVVIDTALEAEHLLASLLEIEAELGRVRGERFGPRIIDLDLIVYVNTQVELPGLHVPHPRAHERRFVLEPLAEVWADADLGIGTAGRLVSKVGDQVVHALATEWWNDKLTFAGTGKAWVIVQFLLLGAWVVILAVTTGPVAWWWPAFPLVAAGAGLAISGAAALKGNLTPFPRPVTGATLTARGPYRLVRHPIYGGLVLALAGIGMAVRSLPAVLLGLGLIAFFAAKSRAEERYLRLVIPEYAVYRQKVTKRFIPLVF
jgi:protein-S-isoprenylcysteine O-methyltransferase Ste14